MPSSACTALLPVVLDDRAGLKNDIAEVFEFDHAEYERGIRMVNPDVPIFHISCKTGDGVDSWTSWLTDRLAELDAAVRAG